MYIVLYIMVMDTMIPISTARAQLPTLIDRVAKSLDRFVITVSGKPKAVVLSQDELESIEETAEILAIPGARKAIAEGERQLKKGQGVPLHQFLKKHKIVV